LKTVMATIRKISLMLLCLFSSTGYCQSIELRAAIDSLYCSKIFGLNVGDLYVIIDEKDSAKITDYKNSCFSVWTFTTRQEVLKFLKKRKRKSMSFISYSKSTDGAICDYLIGFEHTNFRLYRKHVFYGSPEDTHRVRFEYSVDRHKWVIHEISGRLYDDNLNR
jgi:hypothetical protein